MKKTWKIIGRVALGLFLTVYVAVALVNYSVVQSYLGTAAGHRFSRQWGGEVHIGSLSVLPWDHMILNEVLLVSPTGDTIFDGESVRVAFRRFPYRDHGLHLQRVVLRNAYYHFASFKNEGDKRAHTNLQFIIDYYAKNRKPKEKKHHEPFEVSVETLILNHVHYRMDLPDRRKQIFDHGVQIPHMEFYDIRGRIKDIDVINDDVSARIVKLATEERSGFIVNNIAGRVHVSNREIVARDLNVVTPKSHILCEAELTYDGWLEMKDYVHTVMHRATIKEGTTVAMSDVAYWAPVLWGIDAQLAAEGYAEGTVDALSTDGLHVGYGLATEALVAGSVKGLPGIDTTVFDIDHFGLRAEEADLRRLRAGLGERLPNEVDRWIERIGYLDLEARGKVGMADGGTASMDMVSGMGNLRADARLHPLPHSKGWHIALDAGSDGMGLAWMGSDWLTHSGLNLSAEADWQAGNHPKAGNDTPYSPLKNIAGHMDAELISAVVRGQRLAPVTVKGTLNDGKAELHAESSDSLASFTLVARADMADSIRRYDAELDLRRFDGTAFGLLPERFGLVHTKLLASLHGRDADDMSGTLRALDTRAGEARLWRVTADLEGGPSKRLRLESDALGATLTGHFSYNDLPLMIRHFRAEVLPADMAGVAPLDSAERAQIADNTMTLNAVWTDDGRFMSSVSERIHIAEGTRLGGSYNSAEQLKLVLRSDSMSIGGVALRDIGLNTRTTTEGYVLEAESQEVAVGKAELLRRVNVAVGSNSERLVAEVAWGDYNAPTRGDLMFKLRNGWMSVLRPDFYIGDDRWTLSTDSVRVLPSVKAESIALESNRQRIGARLSLEGTESDCVELDFSHFDAGRVADLMLQGSPVSIDGLVDGRFSLYGLSRTPYFNANLTVDSSHVNGQNLGEVKVRSNWNAELNTLNLNLASDQLRAHGWMGLGQKTPDLNFAVDFNGFELGLVAPLLASFSSRFEGQLHGNFDIGGTTANPIVVGEAMVENGALKVDMTDVTYYFSDSLLFDNSTVTLKRFKVIDPRGNLAYVDGTIGYRGMDNIVLDLVVETENLMVLDKRKGDQFYGTLLAAAEGTIDGRIDDLNVNVNARTKPGCTLTVPVSNQRQMKQQNYITFVGDEPTTHTHTEKKRKSKGHFNLELDLGITPDMKLNLPMDFSEVGVTVGANGSGDLHLSLDEQGTPQVLGSYEITNGTMKLSLLSLVDKNFSIEPGSSLGFQGSLPDARFDLKAVYSQRVNLSTLTGSLSTVDNTEKYLQVENIIAVSGTVQDPTLGFDLRLPNADQSVEDEVFAYIDRNSERDMLNQTLSLLVSGQFYNMNGNTAAATATSGGIGSLASTLAGALTDMVDFVDINVDYKSATELTREQVDVNISRDWGRWYLESTLGYGGDSREIERSAVSGTVLDALVGYRISPLVHIFAYNRTNNNDYTRMDLPYKQGVGMKLTKDFDRWADLFKKKGKK